MSSVMHETVTRDEQRIRSGQAANCPECRRVIRIGTPPRGDGSAKRFATHGPRQARCPQSRQWAPGWEMNG